MKRVLVAAVMVLVAAAGAADTRTPLSRALADALYCRVAGTCTVQNFTITGTCTGCGGSFSAAGSVSEIQVRASASTVGAVTGSAHNGQGGISLVSQLASAVPLTVNGAASQTASLLNLLGGNSTQPSVVPALNFNTSNPIGWSGIPNTMYGIINSASTVAVTDTGYSVKSNGLFKFSNSTTDPTGGGNYNASISTPAAGVVRIGDGDANANGWLQTAGACYVTADQTNATTTFASTTCSMTVRATRKYSGLCELYLSDSVAADGAKIDFNGGSATSTNFIAQVTAFDTALNLSSQASALSTAVSATTFTGAGAFEVHFSFESNAAGTFIPEFAQVGHTTGTLTLKRGSNCRMTDMQ